MVAASESTAALMAESFQQVTRERMGPPTREFGTERQSDIRMISAAEFHACCPEAQASPFLEECEHWTAPAVPLFGAVIHDHHDNDWSAVLLGPDQSGRLRCFDLCHSKISIEAARDWLLGGIREVIASGTRMFPQ